MMSKKVSNVTKKTAPRVGLAVVFAALGKEEEASVVEMWAAAGKMKKNWRPAFCEFTIDALKASAEELDVLVYLGESSRFERVAGELSKTVPVVFVKSTVEELMDWPQGTARRYRMSTGVNGIARALAAAAPLVPSVDWTTLPWPQDLLPHVHLDEAEGRYVNKSLGAFRQAVEARGAAWLTDSPAEQQPFSVFLTMHDPAAALLAEAALELWPQCTVITADGMVSTVSPSGKPWSERLIRTRHWSPKVLSRSNQLFSQALIDICADLLKYGTTHILFVDGHGGNLTALRQCGIWLRERCIPSAVAVWWQIAPTIDPSWQAIGHADYVEVSAMLGVDESLVDMEAAKLPKNIDLTDKLRTLDPHSTEFEGGVVGVNLLTADITTTGDLMEFGLTAAKDYTIEPSSGTKEMGEKFLEGQADYLAKFIEEFRKVTLPPVKSTGPLAKK